jgi:aspartate/methionine/tyrosine aminotransferase
VLSRRFPHDLSPNAYAVARSRHGPIPLDLTVTNPTACGIPYPSDILGPLASPAGLAYRPDAKGLLSARRAVAAMYVTRGAAVDPEQVVLTASSSEAYAFLFKLLGNPGDGVLVPTPSYPLFEHLAALEGLRAIPYPLDGANGWQPRRPNRTPNGARAAIVVHPNNPTGTFVEPGAAEALAGALPLIADEVFLDFVLREGFHPSFAARTEGLTFALGGLSKSIGLPQLKLSWIVVSGPAKEVRAALDGLEFIADNYLSVATPIQEALPEILRRGATVREAIRSRCGANLGRARALVAPERGVELIEPAGGWSLVLRFPRVVGEEALVLELLEHRGVAVHPGYFFDFPAEGYLVLSLLPRPEIFEIGMRAVLDAIASKL